MIKFQSMLMLRMRSIAVSFVLLTGCTASFYARTAVHTENALRVGNEAWDSHYTEKLENCKKTAPPKTPEAEKCFGPTFEQNKKIGIAMESAVAVLRTFWVGYAAGKKPKELRMIIGELPSIINDLPDEFFSGLKKKVR